LISEAGELKLIDFGIAKVLDLEDGQTLTATGVGMGTPEYMAPEQWMGNITPSVDIYSLGAVLYELITGRKPFTGDTPPEVLIKTVNEPLPRPSLIVAGLPEQVENVLFKALAKKPENRFSSMDEFASAIEDLIEGNLESPLLNAKLVDDVVNTEMAEYPTVDFLREEKQKGNISTKSAFLIVSFIVIIALISVSFLTKVFNSDRKASLNETIIETVLPFTPVPTETTAISVTTTTDQPITSLTPTKPSISIEIISVTNTGKITEINKAVIGPITQINFSPDGSAIAVASSNVIYLLSSDTLDKAFSINNGSPITDIAFSPNGENLASGSNNNLIRIWDVSSGDLLFSLAGHDSSVNSVAFSPDGEQLASGSLDGTIKIWQLSDGALLQTINEYSQGSQVICFSPDGKTLSSGSVDGLIRLWRLDDRKLIGTLSADSKAIYSIVFTPEGKYLFSLGGSITRAWDISTQLLIKTIETQSLPGSGRLAISPDGSILVGGYPDGSIKLYMVSDQSLQAVLSGHTGSVSSIGFSPDGRSLVSGSTDGSIRLWQVDNN
jgi:WD40 repeat protein